MSSFLVHNPVSFLAHLGNFASTIQHQEVSSAEPALIAEMEKRIAALEMGKSYDATKAAVEEIEKEFLIKFRDLKVALVDNPKGTASGSSSKELEALRAENALLKTRVQKLEYRVQHCVESMEQMYKFVEK